MKKTISMLLACLMLLGLCACGGSSGAGETTGAADGVFMAGFSSVNITPSQLGIPMDGHGNTAERLSTGVTSYIYAIAVALTDSEGNTAVVVSADMCGISESVCNEVRNWAKKTLNIPKENIAISAIHQHTCPDANNAKYRPELVKHLKKAIEDAVADRAPAEMYINKVETEALNFIRRAWYKDGGFVTSHSGDRSSGFDHYESDPDHEMRLIKFTREEKKDIVMVNFQCHPHMSSSGTVTSIGADWPGEMRNVVEKELDVNVIYISGAGANMNSTSYDKSQNISTDWKHHGQRAAQYVIDAEDSYTKANTGTIVCKEITNKYPVDHSMDHLLSAAIAVRDASNKGKDYLTAALEQYPQINSKFHAGGVITKAGLGATTDCTLSVITFGDVAFTVHPYEMFDCNGRDLRNGTVGHEDYLAEDQLENPFAMTFIVSKGNGGVGYMPAVFAYPNGGYEVDTTKFAPGTAEALVGDCLEMLGELYAG